MEKILLTIIAICLFILIVQSKQISSEHFKEIGPQETFVPKKSLMNFAQPFKIDYNFPKEKYSISNDKKYYLDVKKTKKYANIKQAFKPNNVSYNPMNAKKLYEKKK